MALLVTLDPPPPQFYPPPSRAFAFGLSREQLPFAPGDATAGCET